MLLVHLNKRNILQYLLLIIEFYHLSTVGNFLTFYLKFCPPPLLICLSLIVNVIIKDSEMTNFLQYFLLWGDRFLSFNCMLITIKILPFTITNLLLGLGHFYRITFTWRASQHISSQFWIHYELIFFPFYQFSPKAQNVHLLIFILYIGFSHLQRGFMVHK